ncbi:MAG: TIGR01212 family radical SAM protein [Ruminococcaceae bacterium]|nr:TIGR01212 family radical SAM protein [Oscillospiraceae bacterium]
MKTLNDYCLAQFGEKLYKLCLNIGCTCPNRDGTLDTRGCIFCSAGGSGEFAGSAALRVSEQIEREKARVAGKFRGSRFIAYFQAYTNTYGPVPQLELQFTEAAARDDIAALSIATRPDCLGDEVCAMLARLARIKPVWVELGLQTVHPRSAAYIRRGYTLDVFDAAVAKLHALGIHTVVHLILGLPGESEDDMLESVRYVAQSGAQGIKLQLLQVLRGTDLANDWAAGKVPVMSLEDYTQLLARCVSLLPPDMVVHRLTGDGPKRLLLAPEWCGDKKRVLNAINLALKNVHLS